MPSKPTTIKSPHKSLLKHQILMRPVQQPSSSQGSGGCCWHIRWFHLSSLWYLASFAPTPWFIYIGMHLLELYNESTYSFSRHNETHINGGTALRHLKIGIQRLLSEVQIWFFTFWCDEITCNKLPASQTPQSSVTSPVHFSPFSTVPCWLVVQVLLQSLKKVYLPSLSSRILTRNHNIPDDGPYTEVCCAL